MITTDLAIDIKNLDYCYPDGQCALKSVNFVVSHGESVALIGPNGAGKSTLLLHLNGILRAQSDISVCGLKIEDKNIKEIRKKVGMVFQDPEDQLFSLNVFEDVAFGPLNMNYSENEVNRRVSSALQKVGMEGYEKRSSHHLSIGEKKRIAIATVLSLDPEILALDEPTGSLDPCGKWSLIELLREVTVTKIIASHDLELVLNLCSRTLVLDKGRIVADGSTADILGDKIFLKKHGLGK
ncbi:MAG: ABC transporter ATP-binding protein [Dehalococcoidia bacterium]|nr:ABC transporter ATP-binding protein [Dehalococcoidia bacterium]MDD5495139.1 ABC transporter ATP-binding protein [Dehalococcoidia bacterium]